MDTGVTENNVKLYISEVENQLKTMQRFFELERGVLDELEVSSNNPNFMPRLEKVKNPKQVTQDMKVAFDLMGKKIQKNRNNIFLLNIII
jgi:hypothetical protein